MPRSSVALDKLLHNHVVETEPNGCLPSLYRISNAVRREHFRRVRKIAKSDYKLCRVCLSILMELGFHWTDFHETLYLSIFRKSVDKVEVWLKSDKNNGYFTWRPMFILIVSLWILLRMSNVSDKSCRENQIAHHVFNNSMAHAHWMLDT